MRSISKAVIGMAAFDQEETVKVSPQKTSWSKRTPGQTIR
jgi:hypothetical protein